MLRPRFLRKLYVGYLALLIAAVAAVGALAARRASLDMHQTMRQTLQTQAFLLRDLALQILDASAPQDFAPRLRRQSDAIGSQLTVIRLDGAVVADSADHLARLQNHAERPEIARLPTEE